MEPIEEYFLSFARLDDASAADIDSGSCAHDDVCHSDLGDLFEDLSGFVTEAGGFADLSECLPGGVG